MLAALNLNFEGGKARLYEGVELDGRRNGLPDPLHLSQRHLSLVCAARGTKGGGYPDFCGGVIVFWNGICPQPLNL